MRTKKEVTADKLRGGFYTPAPLVDFVLRRLAPGGLADGARLLEPSVGDGAFLRGLSRLGQSPLVTAVELSPDEATKARAELRRSGLKGTVVTGSALSWEGSGGYDAATGNLPFVRFQFISAADRTAAARAAAATGMSDSGVGNLWIPMLVVALTRLRVGGRFAFVLPAECFTGVSAGRVREWLLRHHNNLMLDLFPPGSFPDVLQEVVVLSGQRSAGPNAHTEIALIEHAEGHHEADEHDSKATVVRHRLEPSGASWTRLLLTGPQLEAYEFARGLAPVTLLADLAKLEVATVTGANSFFSVNAETVAKHALDPWLTPLLPRIRHATGLRFTTSDHKDLQASGSAAHLLTLTADTRVPAGSGLRRYLDVGEDAGLSERFKCRIRDPWYAVPGIKPSRLMLTKRSHHYPRMVLNEAGVATTDTIYRGEAVSGVSAAALVATFHNSLTLLSAELEGRSFGGGVLELVPSEFKRLLVPNVPDMEHEIGRLDHLSREGVGTSDAEALVQETDRLLSKHAPDLTDDVMERLAQGRNNLLARRHART
ncbi:class I SAM-dependent methyltransferase [Aquipuribacter sp. SD81]|uniref:class I SAM-dependent methyltransferase n=1 Tax=Aquipuribacter sp. SD81 TaxID=3127703 RepID=UPI003016DCDF